MIPRPAKWLIRLCIVLQVVLVAHLAFYGLWKAALFCLCLAGALYGLDRLVDFLEGKPDGNVGD